MNMDVANGNTSDGTNIQQWTPTGGTNQQFTLTDLGDGQYSVISVKTGKSLDVADVSIDNFANIQQWSYVGGNNQKFILISTDNGYYKLKAVHSGKIIEVRESGQNNGDNIDQYDDNDQINGQWKLVPVTGTTVSDQIEAEFYNSASEVQVESCSEGGSNVGYIDTNDWMAYNSINFPVAGTYTFEFRVASVNGGELSVDLNAGSIVLGTVQIPATGDWQNWETVKFYANVNAGTYNLGLNAKTGGWNINWIRITHDDKTDLGDASILQLNICPNPVGNLLILKGNSINGKLPVNIINANGISVMNAIIDNQTTMDVSSLKPGMYFMQMIINNKVQTIKFIKE